MKKILYIMFIVSTVIMTSACSSSIKQENLELTQEIKQITQENQVLVNEIKTMKKNSEGLEQELLTMKSEINELKKEMGIETEGESRLIIYGADIDTYEQEVVKQINVKNSLPLKEKLEVLADALSEAVFEGLGIEVSEIMIEKGKQIATINLTEKDNNQGTGWDTIYFQGSAGGAITFVSLRDTFLQGEYNGQWIDGVRFLYENEIIEFQHVEGLSEISYR